MNSGKTFIKKHMQNSVGYLDRKQRILFVDLKPIIIEPLINLELSIRRLRQEVRLTQ